MQKSSKAFGLPAAAIALAGLLLWLGWPESDVRQAAPAAGAPSVAEVPRFEGETLASVSPLPSTPSLPANDLGGAEAMRAIHSANPRPANDPGSDLPPQADEYVTAGAMGHFPQPAAPLRIASDKPIPELFPHQELRLKIETLASSYDVANIPVLAAYLDHADPMVRDSARMGLIQLSRPEAAPVLRAAAKRASDAGEAAALMEAAEFLASVASSS